MCSVNADFGKVNEQLAAEFLIKNGYQILRKNFRSKKGEIDIIAKDQGTICFVEVKARKSADFGLPEEAVGLVKQKKISLAALYFLSSQGLLEKNARFDVISILWQDDQPKFTLFKDAFEFKEGF
ncbi:MAG: YraN family protein [Candidatus Omnitrophica bacterium]|nr:YraN family protein [Candidatus Omnitrophota bacterium]